MVLLSLAKICLIQRVPGKNNPNKDEISIQVVPETVSCAYGPDRAVVCLLPFCYAEIFQRNSGQKNYTTLPPFGKTCGGSLPPLRRMPGREIPPPYASTQEPGAITCLPPPFVVSDSSPPFPPTPRPRNHPHMRQLKSRAQ